MKRISIPSLDFSGLNRIVEIPVRVEEFTNIGAVTLEITYNTNFLRYESIDNSTNGHFRVTYNEPEPGCIRIVFFGSSQTLDDNSILFTINFTTILSGVTNLSFSTNKPGFCEIADFEAEVLPFTFEDGQITIED
jgi:hypothetical protein